MVLRAGRDMHGGVGDQDVRRCPGRPHGGFVVKVIVATTLRLCRREAVLVLVLELEDGFESQLQHKGLFMSGSFCARAGSKTKIKTCPRRTHHTGISRSSGHAPRMSALYQLTKKGRLCRMCGHRKLTNL